MFEKKIKEQKKKFGVADLEAELRPLIHQIRQEAGKITGNQVLILF